MAKDPAFLFYSSDFLTGTFLMSDEQVGIYIRLLCYQHQHGRICDDDMKIMCKSHHAFMLRKFSKDDSGLFYNFRLEEEINKRRNYSESRRKNRTNAENEDKKPEKHSKINTSKPKNISSSYVQHMENENEIVNVDVNTNEKRKSNRAEKKIVYPFDTPDFIKTWELFLQYKIQRKEKYTQIGEQAQLKKLSREANGDVSVAIAMINQSLENNWQGIFPLKTNQNGTGTTNNPNKYADLERELAETLGFSPNQ